jgi:hypothetical protein
MTRFVAVRRAEREHLENLVFHALLCIEPTTYRQEL